MAVVSLNGIFTLKVMRSPLMIPHSMGDSPAPWIIIEPVTLPSFVFSVMARVWFPAGAGLTTSAVHFPSKLLSANAREVKTSADMSKATIDRPRMRVFTVSPFLRRPYVTQYERLLKPENSAVDSPSRYSYLFRKARSPLRVGTPPEQ